MARPADASSPSRSSRSWLIALLGTLIGLAVGATLPYVVSRTAGSLLPVPVEPHVYARELAQGALYGLLTALAFALWPLGRAHDVPVSALFRDQVEPDAHWPRKRYMAMVALAVIALAGSAILLSFDRRIAVAAVVGTAGAFVLLRLVASPSPASPRACPGRAAPNCGWRWRISTAPAR